MLMFIRIKRIAGKEYAYLVQNDWTYKGPRQTVAEYLGTVYRPTKRALPCILPSNFREALLVIVEWELKQHGFVSEGTVLVSENIICDLRSRQVSTKKNRPVVLALNEGYLCSKTLQALLGFVPGESEEATGRSLASALVTAGMQLAQDDFIRLVECAHR